MRLIKSKRRLTTLALMMAVLILGAFGTTGECYFNFCNTCERESWKRFDDEVKTGGNGCDGTTAQVEYCGQQCPTCKFCSLRLAWLRDACS